MATAKNQAAWRERKKLGRQVERCQCGKKLRLDSRDKCCSGCWRKSPEGKAYAEHYAYLSANEIDASAEAKKIADKYKQELGFVNIAALKESESKKCLETIPDIGFCHFHHRQDSQTTIYSLAVSKNCRGEGWGRLLFYRVLASAIEQGSRFIIAKCPEALESNSFYSSIGFQLVDVEPGRKRKLNVWRYNIQLPLLFYCADGGRNRYGSIAKEEGWMLGYRSDQTDPNQHVMMLDNHYTNYDYQHHLKCVKKHKPLIASVQDIENVENLPRLLKEWRELSKYCGKALLIPKVKTWLPKESWLGYSVESSYGGTEIETEWFGDRLVHLLGGSPMKQYWCAERLNAISLDGNYAMNVSRHGTVSWVSGEAKIQDLSGERGCYPAFRESLRRQKKDWHLID